MTEQQWLTCDDFRDVAKMLDCLKTRHQAKSKAGRRKLRLFACASCRQVWSLLQRSSRLALECAEDFADGRVDKDELKRAETASRSAMKTANSRAWQAARGVREATRASIRGAFNASFWLCGDWREREGHVAADFQRNLLRCIFGNPFHPVTVDSAWRTSSVLSLAQTIYDDRAFDRMPILGDALEEVGCANQEILGHCRGPGPHVRGCWVVDLLLGKE